MVLVLGGTAPAAATDSPDVLVITVDTLRADHVSSFGRERGLTPNLDRLAAKGVRFLQARTVEPLTQPSMCSMLTSMHPHEHGATRNGLRIRLGMVSLPTVLAARDYRTAAFVSNWTLKPELSGLEAHFMTYEAVTTRKRWFGLVRREASAGDLTEEALAWLDRIPEDARREPVLLWVHYTDPHAPYLYRAEEGKRLGLSPGSKSQRYATEVAFTDRWIGELLGGFRRRRPGRSPLIVFAADHGESLGDHGYWGHGRRLYEQELRIPMAVIWEGRVEPGTVTSPASNLDLAPTVMGLLGLTPPRTFRGQDWTSVLEGAPEPLGRVTRHQAHKGAVMVNHRSGRARRSGLLAVALVGNPHKELFRLSGQRLRFDLEQDPEEQRPVPAPDEAPDGDLLSWLQSVRAGLRADHRDAPELDVESLERLRSLGYVD